MAINYLYDHWLLIVWNIWNMYFKEKKVFFFYPVTFKILSWFHQLLTKVFSITIAVRICQRDMSVFCVSLLLHCKSGRRGNKNMFSLSRPWARVGRHLGHLQNILSSRRPRRSCWVQTALQHLNRTFIICLGKASLHLTRQKTFWPPSWA